MNTGEAAMLGSAMDPLLGDSGSEGARSEHDIDSGKAINAVQIARRDPAADRRVCMWR
jgi:hypothetical protein